ncbi:hypothetical protein [Aridibaculum aurantiacum]|uniref:hypothetical protein n=1 Tax=Aridibaculum aurantiacum TaxID=2810307 RepID=UPI001A961066|nr:hypothetical protein [Aridibaculum aurantiacum]
MEQAIVLLSAPVASHTSAVAIASAISSATEFSLINFSTYQPINQHPTLAYNYISQLILH